MAFSPVQSKVMIVAVGIVLVGVALFWFRGSVLLAAGDFLVIRDTLQPADIIHVISGLDDRTDYGIELYKLGYAKAIFFTGGWCSEIEGIHAERGRERAIAQGVPAAAIAIDPFQVTSTWMEAERLADFMAHSATPIRSVIIVSDPFHMRRARWAYQQILGPDVKIEMAPVPFGLSPNQRQWWTDDQSKAMVESEYLKFGYYIVRYRLTWGRVQTWLALARSGVIESARERE